MKEFWHNLTHGLSGDIANILPRKIVCHCAMRVLAHATTGKHCKTVVPDIAAMEALERWDEPNEIND